MLWVNLLMLDTIHSKGNKFVTNVKIKATFDSNFGTAPHEHFNFFLGDQRKQYCYNGSTGQNIMTGYMD